MLATVADAGKQIYASIEVNDKITNTLSSRWNWYVLTLYDKYDLHRAVDFIMVFNSLGRSCVSIGASSPSVLG
jgi:hypothetical protein